MKGPIAMAGLGVALVLLGGRAWERWGPAHQTAVPASAEVAQWDARTCGPAAVATLLNVYGKPWSKADLERECRVGPRGSSMFDLRETLRRHGLDADGLRAADPVGMWRASRPYIAYLKTGHFVVVTGAAGPPGDVDDRLLIYDPTFGRRRIVSADALYRESGGWLLSAAPL